MGVLSASSLVINFFEKEGDEITYMIVHENPLKILNIKEI